MTEYKKTKEAIAGLSPEQFRVTQRNGTERPGTGEYLDNKEPAFTSTSCRGSRCSRPPTSINRVAAGRASPSRSPANINELPQGHGIIRTEVRSPTATTISAMCSPMAPPTVADLVLHQFRLVALRAPLRNGGRGIRRLSRSGRGDRLTAGVPFSPAPSAGAADRAECLPQARRREVQEAPHLERQLAACGVDEMDRAGSGSNSVGTIRSEPAPTASTT